MTAARYPVPDSAATLAQAWPRSRPTARTLLRGFVIALRTLLREGARRRRHAADLRQLHAMSDHELRDLGLARCDLPALRRDPVLGDDWRSWHRLPGGPL
ncbi:MAG: DUF1127 domain-containing protein [Burkholderiaceae bacterium]|nr:DUF1127 domain-containing protein [Burkholderiaceae bacterium]